MRATENAILIKDIMTKNPTSIEPESSLMDAWLVMHENGIKHLPVVSEGKVCGILSDRDLLCEINISESIGTFHSHNVDYAMNPNSVTASSKQTMKEAVDLMLENNIHSVVVVDPNKKLLGIVTDRDVLKHVS